MIRTFVSIETADICTDNVPLPFYEGEPISLLKPEFKISVIKKDNSQYILGINKDGDVEINALGGKKISIHLDSPSQIKIQTT